MMSLIIGTVLLSLLHAIIPNHWLPLVVISRAEKWPRRETLSYTVILSLAHILSTVVLGLLIGWIGISLAARVEIFSSIVAPVILILMGLIYFTLNIHQHVQDKTQPPFRRGKTGILIMLMIGMFFSPCLEIETIYLAGGVYGYPFLLTISFIYLVLSMAGIFAMTWLSMEGFKKLNWYWIEHNEKRITGMVLIALGIISYLINLH